MLESLSKKTPRTHLLHKFVMRSTPIKKKMYYMKMYTIAHTQCAHMIFSLDIKS